MYKSSISLNDFAEEIQNELELSPFVSTSSIVRIVNSVEQLLYSEIINEIRKADVDVTDGRASLSGIEVSEGEDTVNAYDVIRVFDDRRELAFATSDDAYVMNKKGAFGIFDGDSLSLYGVDADRITVFYKVRPVPKSVEYDKITPDVLNVPEKFTEMFASRLRGEFCKIAGDDGQAAKWLNDYNTYLEDFRIFASKRAGVDV